MNHPACYIGDLVTTISLPAVAAVVAAMAGPAPRDSWAAVGAMLGTVVAVLEARKKDRSLASTVTVVITSAVSGAVAPGAVVLNWFPQYANISWHVWAGLGFGTSLVGWAIVIATMRVLISRAPAAGESFANKVFPKPTDQDPKP